MTKHGHIPEEWIVSYAAGQLSDAKSLLVATHLCYHDDLRSALHDAEAVGGSLLETGEETPLSEDALDSVFARIDSHSEHDLVSADAKNPGEETAFDTPLPLATKLNSNLDDLSWRFMGPGMRQHKIWDGENGECLWLLRAKGGTEIPLHDHQGTELTLILKGSYQVEGKRFGPGDIEIADKDLKNHQPIIDEGEDCICLVVTDAPIHLHSFIGRLVQPFIGL